MKLKTTLKALLGLIGFVIVVSGFLYSYMNPYIYTTKTEAHGQVYVEEYQTYLPLEGVVTIMQVNYWNQNGFIIMAIGLATILLGLVLGDIEIFEAEKEEPTEKPFVGFNR